MGCCSCRETAHFLLLCWLKWWFRMSLYCVNLTEEPERVLIKLVVYYCCGNQCHSPGNRQSPLSCKLLKFVDNTPHYSPPLYPYRGEDISNSFSRKEHYRRNTFSLSTTRGKKASFRLVSFSKWAKTCFGSVLSGTCRICLPMAGMAVSSTRW